MTGPHPGLAAVERWSLRIHGDDGPTGRHAWCMAAARAILDDTELPPAGRGTAFGWRATAQSRAETISRLLDESEPS
jgi:hypothetical protein